MLELRTLSYFVALIQEGNISRAAQALHVTQPTLSRQLAALEAHIGKQLYERRAGRVVPTEAGCVLYDYAVDMLALQERAESEIFSADLALKGDVHIGAAETPAISYVARAIAALSEDHPSVSFHLTNGATNDLMGRLESGILDFMLECEVVEHEGCNSLVLPTSDRWMAVVREDDPLASRAAVRPEDFEGKSIVVSRQAIKAGALPEWFGESFDKVKVLATHNITTNSTFFVREGMAYTFTFEGLHDMRGLELVPLEPEVRSSLALLWRKGKRLSKPALTFLDYFKRELGIFEE